MPKMGIKREKNKHKCITFAKANEKQERNLSFFFVEKIKPDIEQKD